MKLLRYIKGLRKGKEAHRIELEAMKDSFLSDALDGFNTVDGNHPERISRLQKNIQKQITNKNNAITTKKSAVLQPKNTAVFIPWKKLSIAATVLICLSLGGYYLLKNEKTFSTEQQSVLSESQKNQSRNEKPLTSNGDTLIIYMPEPLVKKDLIAKVQINEKKSKNQEVAIVQSETSQIQEPDAIEYYKSSEIAVNRPVSKSDTTKQIKGIVTDKAGDPLIGVSVSQKGSAGGTVTDVNGNFILGIADNKSVILDYIGYDHVELTPDTNKPMVIAMNESSQSIDEVVVVGFGSQKKIAVTGAITAVDISKERATPYKPITESDKETKPEPEIGMKAYNNYLKSNLIHPTDSICKDVKGKVKLRFSVNKDGMPYNIEVIKSLCKTSDIEAIRLIQSGGKWKYGNEIVEIEVSF